MWYRLSKIILSGRDDIIRIIGPDRLEEVRRLSPDAKYQTAVAFFLKQGVPEEAIIDIVNKLSSMPKANIPVQASLKGVQINSKLFVTWNEFAEYATKLYTDYNQKEEIKNQKQIVLQGNDDLYTPGTIMVQPINSVEEAIRYGLGTSWCIAQPGNANYQGYRDMNVSTFYFIFDGTREIGDPLRRVAVDAAEDGIMLTDLNNTTGTISEFGKESGAYLKYLSEHGVNTAQFVNKSKTREEEEIDLLIGGVNTDAQWFENLSYNLKSRYIGRGHKLTKTQLTGILKERPLIEQYINTGRSLPPSELEMIFALSPAYSKTYYRARGIAIPALNAHLVTLEQRVQYAVHNCDFEFMDYLKKHYDLSNVPTTFSNYYGVSAEFLTYIYDIGYKNIDWNSVSVIQPHECDIGFYRKFANLLEWKKVSMHHHLPPEVLDEFANRLDWYAVSGKYLFDDASLDKYINLIDFNALLAGGNAKITESMIRKHVDKMDEYNAWNTFSSMATEFVGFSDKFFEDFADKLNWNVIIYRTRGELPHGVYKVLADRERLYKGKGASQQDIINANDSRRLWEHLSESRPFTIKELVEFKDVINWNIYAEKNHNLDNDILYHCVEYLPIDLIAQRQPNIGFNIIQKIVRLGKDTQIFWDMISWGNHQMLLSFVAEHKDKINWKEFEENLEYRQRSLYEGLDRKFLTECAQYLNWFYVLRHQNVDVDAEFLIKYVPMQMALADGARLYNQDLFNPAFLEKHKNEINWYEYTYALNSKWVENEDFMVSIGHLLNWGALRQRLFAGTFNDLWRKYEEQCQKHNERRQDDMWYDYVHREQQQGDVANVV
jgi:hypothetical protein